MCSVPTGGTGARKALDTCIKGMRGQRVLALGLVVYARALGWESGNRGCPPDSTDSFSWSHLLKTSWFQSCVCVCVCVCALLGECWSVHHPSSAHVAPAGSGTGKLYVVGRRKEKLAPDCRVLPALVTRAEHPGSGGRVPSRPSP